MTNLDRELHLVATIESLRAELKAAQEAARKWQARAYRARAGEIRRDVTLLDLYREAAAL